jgi:sulfotransferase family protein
MSSRVSIESGYGSRAVSTDFGEVPEKRVALKCNLVIPGFAKSGTSSLHRYLALHPDICMAASKEPHFFSRTASWQRGYDWYNSIFQCDEEPRRWYGESSTSYSVWEPALEKIKRFLHQPRLIVILRHPVQRLISHYNWLTALGLESRPLLRAVREEEENGFNPDVALPGGNFATYRRASHYSRFCPVMELLFGKENILYVRSEDLSRNPQGVLNNCFGFLGLEELRLAQEITDNATKDKSVQRTFGLDVLLKLFPRSLVNRIDPDGRLKNLAKRALGRKKIRPWHITYSEKNEIVRILNDDIAFYESVFR